MNIPVKDGMEQSTLSPELESEKYHQSEKSGDPESSLFNRSRLTP